ncbi:efflux RND transporter periplasmic adaptor subunit [Sphingobacteriaceae bacterium WQ 2009]|uniref:Efflux RND transporter periplasmic adaptor subunit n=1 Tax=Rhinopithecimicrobium faecis TaxID=2820698 RepID=A0A8T4HBU7_9SPHI|nr:efflux RND transporter periplasmic adaptor subunit [Sphingobacteriaceae bacterium WQ 2009]
MKRVIISVLVIAVVAASIAWVLTNNKKKNEEKTAIAAQTNSAVVVKAIKAAKQELNVDFVSNGNFQAFQDITLKAESAGRITKILVKEGDRVSKGQLLAMVDADYANLDYLAAKEALVKAKADQARYQSAYATGGVTKAQVDDMNFNVKSAEVRIQQATRKQSDANIRAPFSGVINKKIVELGTYAAPGTDLFEIVDISKLKLAVTASEAQVVQLKIGSVVKITSTVFPDKVFSGQVTFIAPKADAALNYPIEITLANSGSNDLKAGMYGSAVFAFPNQAQMILIPRTAFVGGVNSNLIYVIDAKNKAVERKVVAGRILGEQVEIISGLEEGESVVTTGQINVVEGVQLDPQYN